MQRISPLLAPLGITRVAEITRLDDDLGVPVYTAVRPGGLVLQTGNGKGLTPAAARVSAIMEAIELHHAEHPDSQRFIRASAREIRRRGLNAQVPRRDSIDGRFFHSPDSIIDWVQGEDLISSRDVWIPASAAFFIEPTIYQTHTNGLASGNHVVEATLHGLYELLERDAVSRLVDGDKLRIREACRVVDLETVTDETLQRITHRVRDAHGQLILMKVPSRFPVHVFWAVLLNHRPFRASTMLNTGSGAHLDMHMAATRAITEAIQSRLTLVQAARDDIIHFPSFNQARTTSGVAFQYFANLDADARWDELDVPIPPAREMRRSLASLLQSFKTDDHSPVLRIDLTRAELDIPVVKILASSLLFRRELF